jgi:hypothetical protein
MGTKGSNTVQLSHEKFSLKGLVQELGHLELKSLGWVKHGDVWIIWTDWSVGLASTGNLKAQQRLKAELSADVQGSNLEKLPAALVGRLLGVTVSVARSNFQYGGDAGTASRQDRRLRIEAKRYSETTALNERALRGEIDQALWRDPALEAWVLVTTQEVSEQIEQSLEQKGEGEGVPVLIRVHPD